MCCNMEKFDGMAHYYRGIDKDINNVFYYDKMNKE